MKFFRPQRTLLIVGILLGLPCRGFSQPLEGVGAEHSIARWIRPSIAKNEQALKNLFRRLNELPPLTPGRSGERLGFHSPFFKSATEELSVVLDLGEVFAIDRVAMFSVSAVFQGQTIPRYDFLGKFVIEASTTSEFHDSTVLVDSVKLEPMVRPKLLIQASFEPLKARYLRLRVPKHWGRADDRYLTAVGEIMVLSNATLCERGW